MNQVRVKNMVRGFDYAAFRFRRIILKSFKILKKNRQSVDIFLVSNKEIKVLNSLFRGKSQPTNVLSFDNKAGFMTPESKKHFQYLGEIYLAPVYIKSKGEHLDLLAIHGLLHLLGYTHSKSRDTIKMVRLENKLKNALVSN
ncbi:MAG: rRNA maturation RNase YbeY [Patescibacteria group bacterium]